jgi:hypothetical protein
MHRTPYMHSIYLGMLSYRLSVGLSLPITSLNSYSFYFDCVLCERKSDSAIQQEFELLLSPRISTLFVILRSHGGEYEYGWLLPPLYLFLIIY